MKLPNFDEERRLWRDQIEYVVGVDEVGKGCFAGPVTAGAVIFKKNSLFRTGLLSKINDSKLLTPKIRKVLAKEIKREVMFYSISTVGVSTINRFGIGKATQIAIRKCIKAILKQASEQTNNKPTAFVLADGYHIKYIRGIGLSNQKGIVKGDRKSISIAAASIIAKVHRDKLMRKLNKKYPKYGFYRNKGYGTKFHQIAIRNHGLSEIHRTSFNLQKFL
ncbi:MAG: ribonuclease HII [Patescibacteria group bacterium]